MVTRIFKGQTPEQEIGEAFKEEVQALLKKVAHDYHCDVEDLKFSVNNLGIINVQRLTVEERIEDDKKRLQRTRLKNIRRMKGLD